MQPARRGVLPAVEVNDKIHAPRFAAAFRMNRATVRSAQCLSAG
jgi:hypothetical protein